MSYNEKKRDATLTHEDVLPQLRTLPGKMMMKNICSQLLPNNRESSIVFYTVHGEYDMGLCPGGEKGRIDAAVIIWHPDFRSGPQAYCALGLEIKCSVSDLMKDDKLDGKYLRAGLFDYYLLVAVSDEIALKACAKYSGNDAIGVVSLGSGKVLKVPTRQPVTKDARSFFKEQLNLKKLKTKILKYWICCMRNRYSLP